MMVLRISKKVLFFCLSKTTLRIIDKLSVLRVFIRYRCAYGIKLDYLDILFNGLEHFLLNTEFNVLTRSP